MAIPSCAPSARLQHGALRKPLNVVGTVPTTPDGRVLLCKRNIEPPLGQMDAARRLHGTGRNHLARRSPPETDEEAGAQIQMGPLVQRCWNVPCVGRSALSTWPACSAKIQPGLETIEGAPVYRNRSALGRIAFRGEEPQEA